jgi:hypothetical protein
VPLAPRLGVGLAVQVVDLVDGEAQPVDVGAFGVLVVVVAQVADDVDVAALAQKGRGVLGLTAPGGPLDGGGLLFALLARSAVGVADGAEVGPGDLAVAAVDPVQPDGAGQVCVALFDSYECHGELLAETDLPGPGPGCPEN